MATNIEMPKLSDTMTEGTLVSWKVKVGDEVEIGDVIAEIETDKATMEMEAFDEGTITQINLEVGAKAPVGAVLAILSEDGEDTSAPPASSTSTSTASSPTASTSAPAATSTPVATPAPAADGSRLRVSPLARKISSQKGIDLNTVTGTGPGGRITAADLDNVAPATASTTATAPASAAPQGMKPTVADQDTITPLSSMRKIIADRLLLSKQTIPHFYLHVEADTEALMKLRKQVNVQSENTHGNKYSVNDFVLKALISACQAIPEVNAAFNGDSIVQYANVGVSVAIAVEDGLVTPVVKNAQTKSLLEISKEVKDMAVRARDKKLKPNEFDGGTITISNLGAWGIESFDAIVNPPQAAILSVGGISHKPVVVNGEIVVGQRMNIGLSCDHRVIDGAVAATFLNEVKKLIENPALMLV